MAFFFNFLILVTILHVVFGDKATFTFTGSIQTFDVPSGVDKVLVEMWGGGGGGGGTATGLSSFPGGPGGYTKCYLKVTGGQTLYLQVGGGGKSGTGNAFGGGGAANFDPSQAITTGGGGGYTAIFSAASLTATNEMVGAGGGGGGGISCSSSSNLYGGPGGGGNGVSSPGTLGGQGALVTAAGVGCKGGAGAALTGQDACANDGGGSGAGAGGGGHYGGGAGYNGVCTNAGGGGGSGFVGSCSSEYDIITLAAAIADITPPATSSLNYQIGVAKGGNSGNTGVAGGDGLIAIKYFGANDLKYYQKFIFDNGVRAFTVPSGIDQLLVQLWGAGGGAGYDPNGLYSFSGGPGGFVQCYLKVNPGQTLYVQVGQGGSSNTANSFGGGGAATKGTALTNGGGGGYTAIFSDVARTTDVVGVGAGGGGGLGCSAGNNAYGGPGGGLNGVNAGGATGGKGATTTTGGSGCGGGSGSSLKGQNGCDGGGGTANAGGGSGHFGGGAGGNDVCILGAGGGGSGFIGSCNVEKTIITSSASVADINPPNVDLPFYLSGVGAGGSAASAYKGGDGLVVIAFADSSFTKIAGTGNDVVGTRPDSVSALLASLGSPYSTWGDKNGNLYFTDSKYHVIHKIDGTGQLTLFAGKSDGTPGVSTDGAPLSSTAFNRPRGLWGDNTGNNLYVADTINARVWRIDLITNTIHSFAGNGEQGVPSSSGKAINSKLFSPFAGYTDKDGITYISNLHKCVISKVDTNGDISIFAGTAGTCANDAATGNDATTMTINYVFSINGDDFGNIYFTEFRGHSVRKIDSTGKWSTVAGTGVGDVSGDGGLAVNAKINGPSGVWVDGNGNLYVSEAGGNVLRYIEKSTGAILTILEGLKRARGIWSDGTGNLYIPDTAARQILKLSINNVINETRLRRNLRVRF